MPDARPSAAPEFRDWSIPAVRLLQGVVYSDDAKAWDILLRTRSTLESHFARLGLTLIVDEPEGYAYLRQWTEAECPAGYEEVPRLVRRASLGYGPTVLCVLLRDELRRFEESDLHNERCVVEAATLFEQWKALFPVGQDEVRQYRDFLAALGKVETLGFVKKFGEGDGSWEIRRILKARLPVAELQNLKDQLIAYGAASDHAPSGGPGNG